MLIFKSIIVWLVFILAETLNGTVRILWLVPYLGDRLAHQISFVTGSGAILAIATLFVRWLRVSHFYQLLYVGVLWMLLTVTYEMVLGRLILGYSWSQMAANYNLLQGGLMPISLVLLTLAPSIATKIRGVWPDRKQQQSQKTN